MHEFIHSFNLQTALPMAVFFTMAFLAVLFLQSSLDKITDFKGNLEWLRGHFGQSPLKGVVKLLLIKITILEAITGLFATIGLVHVAFFQTYVFCFLACFMSALSLLALFLGQRVAKDYAGAASLVPYMILTVIGFILIFLV